MIDLHDHTIVVTGASRGIGAEIATQLAAKGAHVIGIARAPFDLPGVTPWQCDLAADGAARTLATRIAQDLPACSGLINNAALMVHTDLTRGHHDAEIAGEAALNLTATMQLSVALLPIIARNGPGFINTVTSGLAIAARSEAAVYCATKAGLRRILRGPHLSSLHP